MPGQQEDSKDGKEWAIRNIYIGKACAEMCHGHGFCDNGQCLCDEGYMWATCHPMGYHYQPVNIDLLLYSFILLFLLLFTISLSIVLLYLQTYKIKKN